MQEWINLFRCEANVSQLRAFAYRKITLSNGDIVDANYSARWHLLQALYQNFDANDRALIRWLLKEEFKAYQDKASHSASLSISVFMLYRVMKKKDIFLLHTVAIQNNRLRDGMDVEMIFGRKPNSTKDFLKLASFSGDVDAKQTLQNMHVYQSKIIRKALLSPKDYKVFFGSHRYPELVMKMQRHLAKDMQTEHLIHLGHAQA